MHKNISQHRNKRTGKIKKKFFNKVKAEKRAEKLTNSSMTGTQYEAINVTFVGGGTLDIHKINLDKDKEKK